LPQIISAQILNYYFFIFSEVYFLQIEKKDSKNKIGRMQAEGSTTKQASKLKNEYLQVKNSIGNTNHAFSTEDVSLSSSPQSESSYPYSYNRSQSSKPSRQSRMEARRLDQQRFEQIFNNNKKSQQLFSKTPATSAKKHDRCTCLPNQKQFNCIVCTQNYPILVRRSANGESGHIDWSDVRIFHNLVRSDDVDEEDSSNSPLSTFNSIDKKQREIRTNSSKHTVSPTVLSILALSKPSNTFMPPPNISLSYYSKD